MFIENLVLEKEEDFVKINKNLVTKICNLIGSKKSNNFEKRELLTVDIRNKIKRLDNIMGTLNSKMEKLQKEVTDINIKVSTKKEQVLLTLKGKINENNKS